MRCRSISCAVGLFLISSGSGAHSNPEIAASQEAIAGEKFNTTAEALGVSVRSTDVLLRSEDVGHPIQKPVASPDGKWIAFTSPSQDVLCVFDTATAAVKTVAGGAGVGTDYAWNGSTGELLFRKQKQKQRQGGYEVWRHNLKDESNELELSVDGPLRLVLEPVTGELLVTDAKGKLMSRTAGSAPDKTLRPIVDLRGKVVRLGAGEEPEVLSEPAEQCFDVQHSPDGDLFVYSDLDTLKVRNNDGELLGELGYGINARWAPDGSCLVYQITFDDGHVVVKSDLAVSSPDGKLHARLTLTEAHDEAEPCWTPDGRALLCACEKTGNLLRINLDRALKPAVQGEP